MDSLNTTFAADKKFSWGFTSYKVGDYGFATLPVSGGVRIEKVSTTRAIDVKLPKWAGYATASACMKKSWDQMIKQLNAHEQKHAVLIKKFKLISKRR